MFVILAVCSSSLVPDGIPAQNGSRSLPGDRPDEGGLLPLLDAPEALQMFDPAPQAGHVEGSGRVGSGTMGLVQTRPGRKFSFEVFGGIGRFSTGGGPGSALTFGVRGGVTISRQVLFYGEVRRGNPYQFVLDPSPPVEVRPRRPDRPPFSSLPPVPVELSRRRKAMTIWSVGLERQWVKTDVGLAADVGVGWKVDTPSVGPALGLTADYMKFGWFVPRLRAGVFIGWAEGVVNSDVDPAVTVGIRIIL